MDEQAERELFIAVDAYRIEKRVNRMYLSGDREIFAMELDTGVEIAVEEMKRDHYEFTDEVASAALALEWLELPGRALDEEVRRRRRELLDQMTRDAQDLPGGYR